ncbi:MAG: hypothetical protein E6H05_00960 [Bacillati bacterium ANGP1]|uniref:SMP-30/Gluconolactonase/LRE-like region domain-containing protein n=1 Tax=Candidatus Segetimicrobium genomatis TaxID=2569760 RepID=A0A537J0Z7_9BACT|nr:MAG: hypothetical protein E6H05_00960 [Terrabacteria group bacterium ANGP1]
MRIRNLKHFYPALSLLLFLVVFTTACDIVSSPGAFDSPLYVANSGGDSITIYAPFSNGPAAPIRTISGLTSPSGVAVNAAGETFVANSSTNSITVYSLGANGNAAPIRTISGLLTQLDNPQGIALDAAGNLYVANVGTTTPPTPTPSSITVYGPTATNNAAPINKISGASTGLDHPQGVQHHCLRSNRDRQRSPHPNHQRGQYRARQPYWRGPGYHRQPLCR